MLDRILKPGGMALVQFPGVHSPEFPALSIWLPTHLFGISKPPTLHQIFKSLEKSRHFTLEDLQNCTLDYSKTVGAWRENFILNWWKLEPNYEEVIYPAWIYYLCVLQGMLLSRQLELWQITLSKTN